MNNRRKELMLASAREYCKCVVEGKTLKYNNQANVIQTNATGSGTTYTVYDNTLTIQCNGGNRGAIRNLNIQNNHKYFINFIAKQNFSGNLRFIIFNNSYVSNFGATTQMISGNVSTRCSALTNAIFSDNNANISFYLNDGAPVSNDNKIEISYLSIIDLTAIGLDNITTENEFLATDLGKYIAKGNYLPYETEGKFINARSPIYFKGRNMLSLARTQGTLSGFANTTPRDFKENEYYLGLTMNNYYGPSNIHYFEKTSDTITLEIISGGYGIGFPIKVKPNTNYKASYVSNNDYIYRIGWYNKLGEFLSYNDNITGNFTSPNNAYWGVLVLGPSNTNRTTYTNIIFCEASDYKNKYEPYCSTQVFENGLTLQKGDTYKTYSVDEISYNNVITDEQQYSVNSVTDTKDYLELNVYDLTNYEYIYANQITQNGFYEYVFTAPYGSNNCCVNHGGAVENIFFAQNVTIVAGHKYYLSLNVTSCIPSLVGGLRIANLRLIDLTQLGLSALNDKLRIFLQKNYRLPYTLTNKTIKDQLTRTFKEIDLSTLTWHYISHDMVWYADLPSGCKTNDSQEESGNIIAEKYQTSAFENEKDKTICIGKLGWLVSGGSCIFVFDSNYNNPTQPSGKALIELSTPELMEYYIVRITNPTFEYVSGNIKKSVLEYDFDIFKVGNVPQVFVPIMASPNYLTPKTYARMEQTAETCAYRPSDKHIYINTQYEVDSTQKTVIYMIIPTRMVSRRTINVESENEIDLDFTKQ